MNTALAVVAALGGLVVFGTAIFAIVRAVFSQMTAIKANTEAMTQLSGAVDHLRETVQRQSERIARLEGPSR